MLNNIFNKINLFSRISFRFDLPIKTKILLYDEIHAHILRETIKRDFNILYLRKKKIYFWIYFKQIIFFDFTFKTSSKNFIKFISPKVIITFNDARFDMYELKKDFKDISFISVMNGIRFEKWFKDRKKLWPKNIKIFYGDYFFTLNDYYITHYQKLLKSDYRSLGHFRNNLVNIQNTKYKNEFLYISQLHESPRIPNGIDNEKKEYWTRLHNLINQYLSKSGKKLHILLRRSKESPKQINEINFYKKIYKLNCVFHHSSNWKKKYQIMDKFENIIFSFSTMGIEAISRKKKVAMFASAKINDSDYYFGWPGPKRKEYNFFSSNKLNYNEVKRILDNINNCKQSDWNKKYYSVIKDQLNFDAKNRSLRNLINYLTYNKNYH